MSFYTGTQSELLYSYANPSTNLATFVTEDSLQKTYPPVFIPAGFFFNAGSTGKALRVKAAGQLGSTGTPTFLWSVRLINAASPPAWSAAGVLLGATGALTTASTVTLAPWFLDMDIVIRTVGLGATSTVVSMGQVTSPAGLASPFAGSIPAAGVSPANATVDNSQSYYLYLSCACGTSNSLNLVNLQSLKVFGEN
jgi:hypothetical protein